MKTYCVVNIINIARKRIDCQAFVDANNVKRRIQKQKNPKMNDENSLRLCVNMQKKEYQEEEDAAVLWQLTK